MTRSPWCKSLRYSAGPRTFARARRPPKQEQDLRDEIAGMLVSEAVVIGPQLLQAIMQTIATMTEVATTTIFAAEAAIIWDNIIQCLTAAGADTANASIEISRRVFDAHGGQRVEDGGGA